jgi:thioredoxin 1
MATARKFGVMGTPSTVLVREGKIAEFLVGPQSRERIGELLPELG